MKDAKTTEMLPCQKLKFNIFEKTHIFSKLYSTYKVEFPQNISIGCYLYLGTTFKNDLNIIVIKIKTFRVSDL